MAETTEELRKRPEIRKELERATGEERPERVETHGRDRFWLIIYALVFAGCAAVYFLIGAKLIPLPEAAINVAQRILSRGRSHSMELDGLRMLRRVSHSSASSGWLLRWPSPLLLCRLFL